MADSVTAPATYATQADALLRKNLTFQKRNVKTNCRLISVPIILVLLIRSIEILSNATMNKDTKCGCKCIDKFGTGKCEDVCGVEYSNPLQAQTCEVKEPYPWFPVVQLPEPGYNAVKTNFITYPDLPDESCRKSGSCPAVILVTGADKTFGQSVSRYLIKKASNQNSTDISNRFIGTVIAADRMNFLDPAFDPPKPTLSMISSECPANYQREGPIEYPGTTGRNLSVASVVGYLVVFASGLLGAFFFSNFLLDTSISEVWIIVMELYPGFSLYRGLVEFGEYSGTGVYTGVKGGMKWENLNDPGNGMKEVLIIMLVEWVVVLLVAFYMDQINSSGKSPLFFLENSRKKKTLSTMNLLEKKESGVFLEMEKEDVAQEREKVEHMVGGSTSGYPIVVDNLKKVYPGIDGNPDKYAVRGLSLAVPKENVLVCLAPMVLAKLHLLV